MNTTAIYCYRFVTWKATVYGILLFFTSLYLGCDSWYRNFSDWPNGVKGQQKLPLLIIALNCFRKLCSQISLRLFVESIGSVLLKDWSLSSSRGFPLFGRWENSSVKRGLTRSLLQHGWNGRPKETTRYFKILVSSSRKQWRLLAKKTALLQFKCLKKPDYCFDRCVCSRW